MSGHSKWANIKHKKEKTDAQKAKVFTKIGKEITIAVKEGGGDPASNSKLRDLILKAKSNNVPNDNIERTIKKALGATSESYEEIVYEGYGPAGIAVIVETTTDNRNRTAGNVRSYFSKYHGNLGQTGSVGYLFEEKGVIIISNEDGDIDEDKLMETALEAGAEDFAAEGEVFEIYTVTDDLYAIKEALEAAGYEIMSAEKDKIPSNYVTLDNEEDIKFMGLLIEKLEDDDDVTKVKTLKANFKENFGATLRVYKSVTCKGAIAEDDATLASIRAEGAKGGDLVVKGNMQVGNFEKKVAELYGIGVQVANADDSKLADNSITLTAAGK